jgi:1-acyl-sn-glycerol-3-phosphate acyltransferase
MLLYPLLPVLWPCTRLYWRLRLTGAVQAIPRRGPVLLVANLSSFLDPWLAAVVFPRPIRWLINDDWYHRSRPWNRLLRSVGVEPVRSQSPRATVEAVCHILGQGGVVGLFPEGQFSDDGRIGPFLRGHCYVAAKSGAPLLPLGIRGSFASLPRDRRFPKPVRITMEVGEPLFFPGSPHKGAPPRSESRWFHERIIRDVCRLSGQEKQIPELIPSPTFEEAVVRGTRAGKGVADAPAALGTPDPTLEGTLF